MQTNSMCKKLSQKRNHSQTRNGMFGDPIVDEIRKAREAHAARFNYDLKAIYHDLKQQEKNSGRIFVSYPSRKCVPVSKTISTEGRR